MAVTRRRSRRDNEETEARDERPTRRRTRDDEDRDERPTRGRRSRDEEPEEEERPRRGRRSRDEDEGEEDRPRRGRRSSRDEDSEEERPRRGRGRGRDDEGGSRRRGGSGGFGSYASKKRASGDYANDFKPGTDKKVLIKLLEEGPFASYNQHWIPEMKRKSYVCLDDEDLFGRAAEDGCPLCDIGEDARTFALFNVLDLSNPRKPEVKVWAAPPTVTDTFARAAEERKTSPLNREDVYFEVELQEKSKNQKQWSIVPVLARDVEDYYDVDPFTQEELDDFSDDLADSIKAVTKVDSYDDLADIADKIMD